MPIPYAGWSGLASTAAASSDKLNRSSASHSMMRAAAWLYAHSRTHRSCRPGSFGELARRSGARRVAERAVQAELVTEVDHPRRHRAFELA